MFIDKTFQISKEKDHAILSFENAQLETISGDVTELTLEKEESGTRTFCGEGLRIADKIKDLSGGLFRVTRTICNASDTSKQFKSIFTVKTCFVPEKYVIPCVLYNGNQFGAGGSPAGLTKDGAPWIFAYDREGIPSCTVSENENFGAALFASDCDAHSLESACSLIKRDDGTFVHKLYHPVTEAPVTYSGKNRMTERFDQYFHLAPGETICLNLFVFVCVPKWKNFAMANLLDRVSDVFKNKKTPDKSPERVWELGIAFARQLMGDFHGHKMIYTNFSPKTYSLQHSGKLSDSALAKLLQDPENTRIQRWNERFEIGWADQGLLNARMLARHGYKTGDTELLNNAVNVFDSWAEKQLENGLVYTEFQHYYNGEKDVVVDTCNLGWALAEFARMYQFMQKIGTDKPKYLNFCIRLADFFCTHFNEETGFGKTWTMNAKPVSTVGSIGGFVITGLLETYLLTHNEAYLICAKHAHALYTKRDIDEFVCTAGALDCACVDKETVYPFITSSLMLYDISKEPHFLETAQKAAYYFCSWMFVYDTLSAPDSDFNQFNYYTTGGTAVSAEHPAIDAWGAAPVTEFVRLAELTGDKKWIDRAKAMWCNAILCITEDTKQEIHGQTRPLGGQNEGFFQCRWTKYRPTCEERGHFNDCLSAWCGAYRMMTIANLEGSNSLDLLR